MLPKIGDRIELVEMKNDPHPITPGTQGTVDYVNEVGDTSQPFRDDAFTQIGVKWDSGRSLLLCVPPDRYRLI